MSDLNVKFEKSNVSITKQRPELIAEELVKVMSKEIGQVQYLQLQT